MAKAVKSHTMEPQPTVHKSTVAELRKQTPQERQLYLHGIVDRIERKFPEMDAGAKASFAYFLTKITPIIRPSGGEKAMREHLISWAQEHEHAREMSLAVDQAGNLLVSIEATSGYEDIPGIILQSHMDMNCNPTAQQRPDTSPEVNPVIPVLKDNDTKVATEGTTLGADDGLGMATAITLAEELFSNNIPHGKVALLFTTDEEVGLTGAEGFSFPKELLRGYSYYFNLDNEDSHEAVIGAAGGRNLDIRLPLIRDTQAGERKYFTIDLSGLMGGHSGAEIHLGHLNAIKIIDELLLGALEQVNDMRLVDISSGTTDSAIPQRAHAVVTIKPGQEQELQEVLDQIRDHIIEEDRQTKGSLEENPLVKEKEKKKGKLNRETPRIDLAEVSDINLPPLTAESTQAVLELLRDIPTGPLEVDEQYSIIKTSTNMGILDILSQNKQDFLRIYSLTRSSSEDAMIQANEKIAQVASLHGARVEPGEKKFSSWEPNFEDPFLDIAKATHKEATGKDLDVTVIHAGLESHTIYLKMKELLGDEMPEEFHIISLGPSLDGPHSETEYFDIEEAGEFFPAMRHLMYTLLRKEAEKRGKPFSPADAQDLPSRRTGETN